MTHAEFIKVNERFNKMYEASGLPIDPKHESLGRKRQASKYRNRKGLAYRYHQLNPEKEQE
jgi:hypothetical protein